jgi:hypothetical protein
MQHQDDTAAPTNDRDDAEMFDLAPVSLWLEDYSGIKAQFEEWRRAGVTDLRGYLRADPDRVEICSDRLRVIKVNRKTLTMFEADDLLHLVKNLGRILRDDTFKSHVEELGQLWDGQTEFFSHHLVGSAARHSAQGQHPAGVREQLGTCPGRA